MPKTCYRPDLKFTERKLGVIRTANSICEEYARQGYDLTLRQLYYQFVARGYLGNTLQNYKWLGSVVNDARLAGLMDWDYITDRTRNLRGLRHWDDPAELIKEAAEDFRTDAWATQKTRVEVWIEKDALIGLIARVCNRNDVNYFSCRGYTSQSEAWGAAQRIGAVLRGGQNVLVVHLGDHDPSGVDMSRDISDRLHMFIDKDNQDALTELAVRQARRRTGRKDEIVDAVMNVAENYGRLEVRRVALSMAQVRQYNPPPNPAKVTDSRFARYVERYGHESWELDALSPDVLSAIIQQHIDSVRLKEPWIEQMHVIAEHKKALRAVARRWAEVREFLGGPATT